MEPDKQMKVEGWTFGDSGLKLVDQIGKGGMATVWKAWDEANSRFVAVKILDREFAENVEEVRQFLAEEKTMEELKHPGIVQAYSFSCTRGNWYLVMEYVDGYTFSDLLERKHHISEEDCLLICESVAAALDFAWNEHGLVHCDIKPENIMINSAGEIKLTDLGIAKRFQGLEGGVQEVPDHVTGTPAYISPEQIYGDRELDCRTDIYSLGATLYHLSTGHYLFPGCDNDASMESHCSDGCQAPDPRLYWPNLSEGFVQLLEAMLVKNRDARLQSWQDVFAMAQEVESGAIFKLRTSPGKSSLKIDRSFSTRARSGE